MSFLLKARGIQHSFGGVTALIDFDIDLEPNEIHAVIGPNGAGKTTLISVLAGELSSDRGKIELNGKNVTKYPVHIRSQLGLARTFQITSIFESLTVRENIILATQGHSGHSYRFWKNADQDLKLIRDAEDMASQIGLTSYLNKRASELSHGEHRLLELAMALATSPLVLLLDEPAAGLGAEETDQMADILLKIKKDRALLLIEHDMDLVFSVANKISVMVNGQNIATGLPQDIKNNEAVQEAYLGA